MAKPKVTMGRYISAPADLRDSMAFLERETRFSYVVVPLFHPGMRRLSAPHSEDMPLSRSCRLLEGKDWSSRVVGEVAKHIDVDSINEVVRENSEKILLEELDYATHLSVAAVIIHLRSERCTNLAHFINKWLTEQVHLHAWIHMPLVNPRIQENRYRSEGKTTNQYESPWEWWNKLRSLCDYNPRLGLVLDMSAELPPKLERDLWAGEPVRAIFLRTSMFWKNPRGFPVVSQSSRDFLQKFVPLDTHVILAGPSNYESIGSYAHFLNWVWKGASDEDGGSAAWADYLQSPLQPLMNNLEAQTYEVFEKDPVKYRVYGEAIEEALVDRVSEESKASVVTVVMVMGAGRGPLVQATLDAADRANRRVRVYAVEKNPNAVITLQCRKQEEWIDRVTVVAGDMRRLNLKEKADIIVSELLGSFGDNELSPECLDGAQKFLKEDGISIPRSYTSYLCPVMSHKLFSEAKGMAAEPGKPPSSTMEIPYVVYQQNKLYLAEPVPLFTFHHPNKEEPINNSRYGEVVFRMQQNCVLHGFAGFFHTTLYKEKVLSIVPESFSTGMFSWFPLYIPVSRPVSLQTGCKIRAHIWRCVGDHDVWYEWTISEPVPLPIHNINGRSYKIGL